MAARKLNPSELGITVETAKLGPSGSSLPDHSLPYSGNAESSKTEGMSILGRDPGKTFSVIITCLLYTSVGAM